MCSECESMRTVNSLNINQSVHSLRPLQCIHSKVSDRLINRGGPWRNKWPIPIDTIGVNDQAFVVNCNENIQCIQILDNTHYLAAVRREDKPDNENISVLFTTVKSQKMPFCSSCSRQGIVKGEELCFRCHDLFFIEV